MFRTILNTALRTAYRSPAVNTVKRVWFSHMQTPEKMVSLVPTPMKFLPLPIVAPVQQQTTRSVTKFSLIKGKRKSVKAVIKRFKRLDWGAWIRTHSGRHKKLFKKSPALKRRLRQHVFTNATQSWLLDKMVTSYWRRPKYYIDDPYLPYHKRDEYFATKSKTFKV